MRPAFHMAERHGHHNSQRQPHTGFHFGLTPDKVFFKTAVIVDAVVDLFQCATASITALPGGTAVRQWYGLLLSIGIRVPD